MTKLINIFQRKSPRDIAQAELEEAVRQLLLAQSGQEYAARMVQYHQDRIKRLKAYVEASNREGLQREGAQA